MFSVHPDRYAQVNAAVVHTLKSLLAVPRTGAGMPPAQPPFSFEHLFASAQVPILIVDAGTERIVEANPKAMSLLRTCWEAVRGETLASVFDSSSHSLLQTGLGVARGKSTTVTLRTLAGLQSLQAALSLFRANGNTYFLVQLSSLQSTRAYPTRVLASESPVLQALDGASFGFLVTDAQLRIDYANQAFLEMVHQPSREALVGRPLRQWLHLSESDLARLRLQLAQRQALTQLTACLVLSGQQTPCEVHAIGVAAGTQSCWGFCVNLLSRLN